MIATGRPNTGHTYRKMGNLFIFRRFLVSAGFLPEIVF
jgi:hypothetical protein